MLDREDPKILWVSPDSSEPVGTYEKPFSSLSAALERVQPAGTVVLKRGIYSEDQTIEISGNAEQPIHICAETEGEAIIESSCWYFYDTSDLVISGLVFKNAPLGAVSVVGKCLRNRFHSLKFVDCGLNEKASCTLYFGGAGGRFNLVENCQFIHKDSPQEQVSPENATVALMVSEGDTEGGTPLKNHIFRRNLFNNYDCAILLGSCDMCELESGHIVEYNKIDRCSSAGIAVKCGDTQIRGNLIRKCRQDSIFLLSGHCSTVENNRVVDSGRGITVNGPGHTVVNNCIVRCTDSAVTACRSREKLQPASNLFIQENTIISNDNEKACGLLLQQGTSGIVQKNLFFGEGEAYRTENQDRKRSSELQFVIADNLGSGGASELNGISISEVSFKEIQNDNYSNESGYGAQGWMLTPEAFDPDIDELTKDNNYVGASILEDENGNLIVPEETDKDEIFGTFIPDALDPANMFFEEEDS
ncbi:MAG: right-handed parallel beta-helix repeat-containing protein [Chitinispirillaceae bacterium]